MNEPTQSTGAETATATAAQTGATATTEQDEWQKLADSAPNRDGHVQTTDPLFDTGGSFIPVTVQKPERTSHKDEKGVAVRVNFKFDGESTDTQGNKRAPGYVFRPRPYVIEGASDGPEDQAAAERGRRDLARDMERLGVLPKLGSHTKGALIASIGKLSGRQGKIKLWTKEGTKRDEETGLTVKFQNFLVTASETPEGNGTGAAKQTLGNV